MNNLFSDQHNHAAYFSSMIKRLYPRTDSFLSSQTAMRVSILATITPFLSVRAVCFFISFEVWCPFRLQARMMQSSLCHEELKSRNKTCLILWCVESNDRASPEGGFITYYGCHTHRHDEGTVTGVPLFSYTVPSLFLSTPPCFSPVPFPVSCPFHRFCISSFETSSSESVLVTDLGAIALHLTSCSKTPKPSWIPRWAFRSEGRPPPPTWRCGY